MSSAKIVLYQIAVMFILIFLGYFLWKRKVFTRRGCNQLSELVLTVVCPALIFTSFQKELEPRLVNGLLTAFGLSVISHIVSIALGMIFFGKKRGGDVPVERFAAAYSNCAFMGIPLIEAVYGTDGVFYLTAYIAVFNLLTWTHGVMTMTGKTSFKSAVNALKAPAVIAAALGLVFFFLQIRLPDIVMQPLNYISSLNTPLAMLISGMTIARSDILAALKKPGIYLAVLVKLILAPLLTALIMSPMSIDPVVADTIVISAACPTAAVTIMFAARYGKNSVYAAEIFAVTTAASAVTVPLVLLISSLL
ncbi:MAG: AEC family transporter [Prevotella sp.]|nr:AEC family transporter [Prevotella sp.]